ncbi:MAG TPA: MAPEG family protein [Hyphomicrobiaceae bacterium]|nr:MAPEG family protein [Hyphomicrobiaceae bacterium]
MLSTDILHPVFVQVALTFYLQFWMGRERLGALARGEVKTPDIALGERAWPTRSTQIANAFHNQLELPILFYLLAAFALVTNQVDTPLILLAWVFVGLRLWHAWIHTTHNTVRHRFSVFLAGTMVLLVMWIYFAFSILTASL